MKRSQAAALLDRAWTHSLPARSGYALSLGEILLTRSQLARIKGELVNSSFRSRRGRNIKAKDTRL